MAGQTRPTAQRAELEARARALREAGTPLTDIAHTLNVPASTLYRWASQNHWRAYDIARAAWNTAKAKQRARAQSVQGGHTPHDQRNRLQTPPNDENGGTHQNTHASETIYPDKDMCTHKDKQAALHTEFEDRMHAPQGARLSHANVSSEAEEVSRQANVSRQTEERSMQGKNSVNTHMSAQPHNGAKAPSHISAKRLIAGAERCLTTAMTLTEDGQFKQAEAVLRLAERFYGAARTLADLVPDEKPRTYDPKLELERRLNDYAARQAEAIRAREAEKACEARRVTKKNGEEKKPDET